MLLNRTSKVFLFCLLCFAIALNLPLPGGTRTAWAQGEFEENVIIVKLSQSAVGQLNIQIVNGIVVTGIPSLDALNAELGAREMTRVLRPGARFEARHTQSGLTRYYLMRFDAGSDVPALVDRYSADANLESAQPNSRYKLFGDRGKSNRIALTPNDPLYPNQWHYHNTGQSGGTVDADIDAPEAWDVETGDPSVIVSDLDTGQDLDHPDLAANIWVNAGEIPGNGVDDDANGFIDDVNGWDFSDGDNNPDDYFDHGSHTAGTVAAVTDNGTGVAGVAFDATVMPCKIFPNAFDDVIADAFVYAADNGSIVSTNSWGGGGQSDLIEDAIDYYLATTGGVVVFAAGNDNSNNPALGYPASYPPVMAVAATNHNDQKAWYSNYGDWVDVSAPGGETFFAGDPRGVLSTVIGGYDYFQGTSMACPHVAGVAALLFSANPGMTGEQVRAQIEASTDNIDAVNPGFAGQLGTGRVNAYKALTGGPFPNPPTNLQGSVSGNDVTLTWDDPTTNTDGSPIDLLHINVFRDGSEIAEAGPGSETYVDLGVPDGGRTYYVTATNAQLEESGPSNVITAIVGDIDALIWQHPEVTDPNLAEKARQRGLTEAQVQAMAHQPTSHLALQAALAANGKSSLVITDVTSVNLFDFEAVFAIVGVYPNNYVIPAGGPEALALENYVLDGGKLYMEGADMWYYDPLFVGGHDFGSLFGIEGVSDGTSDLGTVLGIDGTFTQEMDFTYSGQNNYIDHLAPEGDAFTVHANQTPAYNCGVARMNSVSNARTIGTSYEFGGLDDNSASSFTKAELLAQYLGHMGIGGINANFSGNPRSGFVPLTVLFTDLSSGDVATWGWSFEGGTPNQASGPGPHTVVYYDAGQFDVTLIVSGPEGTDTTTKANYITTLIAPDITVSPTSLNASLPPGGSTTQSFTIGNIGGSDLTFSIAEEEASASNTGLAKAMRMRVRQTEYADKNGIPRGRSNLSAANGAQSNGYSDGHAPLREPYSPPPKGTPGPFSTSVLLLHMGGDPSEIQAQLNAFPDLAPVDTWNLSGGNPSLPQLLSYDAAVVMNNNAFPDPEGLGDVLADYVDAGGGVTTTLASFASGFELGGRFMDEGYSPFGIGFGPIGGSSLGSFDASHPVMAGVTSMFGDLLADVPLAAGATLVASWTAGWNCVAVKNTVVAFNIFVASPGFWTGDVPLVLHNAILFSSGGSVAWLDANPKSGTIPAGGNTVADVTFDASELTPGHYYANLVISSNDPDEQEVTVSAHLHVFADAVIWIPGDVIEPDLAKKAAQRGLTVEAVQNMVIEPTSHFELKAAIEANGKSAFIVNQLEASTLEGSDYLFVVLGIFPNNHVVKVGDPEVAVIDEFLATDGKVYMEGGDVWYYDPVFLDGHDFGPTFFVDPVEDGADDLKSIIGACLAAGKHFTYSGQNNFIDRLLPFGSACTIHSNSNPAYDCGIAYSSLDGYRTIGNAFEFGGLDDASLSGSTKETLMAAYLDFFDSGLSQASAVFNFPLPEGGWYLISLPVQPANASVNNLFPAALAAFGWDFAAQNYVAITELAAKQAYWVAMPSATTVEVFGQPLTAYNKTYTASGWDMIGAVMETAGLEATPASNVFAMFGYDAQTGSYESVRNFEPAQGYWIAVQASENDPLFISVGPGVSSLTGGTPEFSKHFSSTPPLLPPFTIDGKRLVAIPTEYGLSQNYPNPFNPETVIEYQMPKAGRVSLRIFDALGREVCTLIEGEMPAGIHRVTWEARNEGGQALRSGVYFYQLQVNGFVEKRKLVLLQ